jgi:galactose mutarotase-like enzyme
LELSADTFGAELHSLKLNGKQYLWQCKDPWKRYAPILFPFICSPKDRKYFAKGQEYTMKANHGFARDMEFECTEQSGSSLSFKLTSDENTLKIYPYDFELTVRFTVSGDSVEVLNSVKNTGNKDMYFYLGAHPAFNCPLNSGESFEDCYVEFDEDEHITQKINGETHTLVEYDKTLDMTRALFDHDSIPLSYPNSKAVSLKSKKSDNYVRLEYPVSDCITIWSPTGDDSAKFVCLEPRTSVPTFYDDDFSNLENKPNAIQLPAGEEYRYYYYIKLF